jgi:hypothetical protein
MFKKLKLSLLAASVVLPTVITASALTMDNAAAPAVERGVDTPAVMPAPDMDTPVIMDIAAENDDEILETAIKAAKTYLGNTDRFAALEHSISEYAGVKTVYLYWSDSSIDGEYLSAVVTGDGVLLRFKQSFESELGLPSITKADAVELAYMYAMKVNPAFDLLSKEYAIVDYLRWRGYQITFHSTYGGYVIENNSVTVDVSPDGKIISYDANSFARGLNLPETPARIISADEAKKALNTSLPLELVYRSFYEYDYKTYESKATIKLVYKLPDDYTTKAVDAQTGDIITIEQQYRFYPAAEETVRAADMANGGVNGSDKIKLSPAEQKVVSVQAGLLSVADIDAALRKVKEFGLDDTLKIDSSTLFTVKSPYDGKLSYKWNLSYKNEDGSIYVNAEVDAKTGEILSFSNYSSVYYRSYYDGSMYKADVEPKYTIEQSEEAVQNLLKSLYGEKFNSYVKIESVDIMPLSVAPVTFYSFNYVRTVNDVKFYDDSISIMVDPDTLGVVSLAFNYTDTKFPSTAGVIGAQNAVDKYFDAVPLEPYYIVSAGKKDGKLIMPELVYSTDEKQLTPVYRYTYYGYIDANSGELLGYDGEPVEYKPVSYFNSAMNFTDIADSPYFKAIKTLYNMDIIDMDGSRFRPDDAITYAELRDMLQNAGYWNYVSDDNTADSTTVAFADALYNVVCAMGYSEIATLDEIFKNPYGDAAIAQGRIGAVAISAALGLLDGIAREDAAPDFTAPITRGEAAQLTYNLLAR